MCNTVAALWVLTLSRPGPGGIAKMCRCKGAGGAAKVQGQHTADENVQQPVKCVVDFCSSVFWKVQSRKLTTALAQKALPFDDAERQRQRRRASE